LEIEEISDGGWSKKKKERNECVKKDLVGLGFYQ